MSFFCSWFSCSCLTLEEKPTLLHQAPTVQPCSVPWLHLLLNVPSDPTSEPLPMLPPHSTWRPPFHSPGLLCLLIPGSRRSVLLFPTPVSCLFLPEPLLQWTISVIFPCVCVCVCACYPHPNASPTWAVTLVLFMALSILRA